MAGDPKGGVGKREALLLAAVVLIALLLHAPALAWGFMADDYGQQLVMEGVIQHPTLRPWSLYDWGWAAHPGEVTFEGGALPWWTPEDWSIRFFRPVVSLTIWLDHLVFGDWPVGYHLTSFAWFALVLVLLHRLYRTLGLSPAAALLATLIFGVEDGNVTAVGWIANRHSLVQTAFMLLGVGLVARARDPGSWRVLLPAFACGLVAAGAKESGTLTFALIALLLVLRGPARGLRGGRLAGRVAASIGCAAAYLGVLLLAGYGANSIFYPTPWVAPGVLAERLLVQGTLGLYAMTCPLAVDILLTSPHLFWWLVIGCGIQLVPFCEIIRRRIQDHPAAAFLAGWLAIGVVSQVGAVPADRMLFEPMVGAAGLLGLFVTRVGGKGSPGCLLRGMQVMILTSTLGLTSVSLLLRGDFVIGANAMTSDFVTQMEVGDPSLGRREAFLLQPPSQVAALTPLVQWMYETRDHEVRFWPVQLSRSALDWTRVDATTFEVHAVREPFLTGIIEGIFLTEHPDAFELGQRWVTDAFEVEAIDVRDGRLHGLRFHLDEDLDRPHLRFLAWRDGRMVHLEPPAIGGTLRLPRAERLSPYLP